MYYPWNNAWQGVLSNPGAQVEQWEAIKAEMDMAYSQAGMSFMSILRSFGQMMVWVF